MSSRDHKASARPARGKTPMLAEWLNGLVLTAVAIQGFSLLGRIVEGDPELAAVVIEERLRKLQVRWEAIR
jgi:hypothetical protein